MNVSELIAELQTMPPDAVVLIETETGHSYLSQDGEFAALCVPVKMQARTAGLDGDWTGETVEAVVIRWHKEGHIQPGRDGVPFHWTAW